MNPPSSANRALVGRDLEPATLISAMRGTAGAGVFTLTWAPVRVPLDRRGSPEVLVR